MARNDGVDRTIVRNNGYQKGSVGIRERHNERKNESYSNNDILLSYSHLNVQFKTPAEGYAADFDRMVAEGIISTRGLKPNAKVIDEMVFDVNSAYFEDRGGYEYAKEFFAHAYRMAMEEVGGEQYILSAVMHADERNRALSEKLGYDVFHYHLHVVYVPVVEKQVLWTKRCKDKALVGTVKKIIMQVSDSKKWLSEKAVDEDGETHLIPSYSKLQDRFFDYMKAAGYADVERGERNSKDKHMKPDEFKAMKEQERLDQMEQEAAAKKVKLQEIDSVTAKPTLTDKTKVVVAKTDLDDLKSLAKKQVTAQKKSKRMQVENKNLKSEVQSLRQENIQLQQENTTFRSVRDQLSVTQLKQDYERLKKKLDRVMDFIDKLGLREKLNQFLYPNRKRDAHDER
ncbi:plasmid recombination protein [Bengtsoniella intestinalis]|uniref:plasmid recombination protein n=1 Tax=Bengtsoniella intestinalis TaxID=3073143 RepID=UPI00391EFA14